MGPGPRQTTRSRHGFPECRGFREFEGIFSLRLPLRRSSAAEHAWHRHRKNPEIEPGRPLIDVLEIEGHPLVEAETGSTLHLPQTRQTRAHAESPHQPRFGKAL